MSSRRLVLTLASACVALAATLVLAQATSPPIGEDVMRPTEHGMRMTPGLAKAFSKALVMNRWQDLDLSRDQQEKAVDLIQQRLMETAHQTETEGREFLEYAVEHMMQTRGRLTQESSRGYAERARPLVPAVRDLLRDVQSDVAPLLNAGQRARLDERINAAAERLDRAEEQMRRWEAGLFEEGERPIDAFEEPPERRDAERAQRRVRGNRREADEAVALVGPSEWQGFLGATERFFGFDEAQKTRGRELLAEYTARANEIMTTEWKDRMRRNRFLFNAQWALEGEPRGPWLWQLQREYNELVQPVNALAREFHRAALGLATDEQRGTALERIAAAGEPHGLRVEPGDEVILGLIPGLSETLPVTAEQ